MQLTVLSGADVRRCVDMREAIGLMSDAFGALSAGEASVPVRTRIEAERGSTLFMPAYLPGSQALGAKVVSIFPANVEVGIPALHAAIVAVDPATGAPAALMPGEWITALRTGAASGLATRLLAREDAASLAVFGAGAQARTQIEAVRAVRAIEEVCVVSRSGASAEALAEDLRSGVAGDPLPARAVASPEEALAGADIVVAATDSSTPVFPGGAVQEGTHVNGVGSYTTEMREVDTELVRRATVFVDDRAAALAEAGDVVGPMRDGAVGSDVIVAELGELVRGGHAGRRTAEEITFFKSVGVAVQDVVVAGHVLERAKALGLGSVLDL
jgi:ornithine cyclodeaminase